jgi:hypothetical protein
VIKQHSNQTAIICGAQNQMGRAKAATAGTKYKEIDTKCISYCNTKYFKFLGRLHDD